MTFLVHNSFKSIESDIINLFNAAMVTVVIFKQLKNIMHIFDLTTPDANKIIHVLYNNQDYRTIYGDI